MKRPLHKSRLLVRRFATIAAIVVLVVTPEESAAQVRRCSPETRASLQSNRAACGNLRSEVCLQGLESLLQRESCLEVRVVLAQVHLANGRCAEALELVREVSIGQIPGAIRRDYLHVRRSEGLCARVGVTTVPADVRAEIFVDGHGRQSHDGELYVNPGTRTIEVRSDGYLPREWVVYVGAGERISHEFSLGRAPDGLGRGIAAIQERRFTEAVDLLQHAHVGAPTPHTRYYLGVALQQVGRYVQALAMFGEYLQNPGADSPPHRTDEVRRRVDEIRQAVVHLDVTLELSGAVLKVDGNIVRVIDGVVTLDPGHHVLEVTCDGYRPWRYELNPSAGARLPLPIPLERAPGQVVVTPSVRGATVLFNGRVEGAGRVQRDVPEGPLLVEVRAPDHETFRRSLQVRAGETVSLDATLVRPPRNRWLLPVGIAAAVVAVASAIVLPIVLTSGEDAPYPGNLGIVMEALRVW